MIEYLLGTTVDLNNSMRKQIRCIVIFIVNSIYEYGTDSNDVKIEGIWPILF